MVELLAKIRAIAEELQLVKDGDLVPLDSIALVQLLVGIETSFDCTIPHERIDAATFHSLEGIAQIVATVVGGRP
jgi:acyl carrier protein